MNAFIFNINLAPTFGKSTFIFYLCVRKAQPRLREQTQKPLPTRL